MIRVILPPHLRTLAQVGREISLEVPAPVTQRAVIDAIEATYPMLAGTIREHGSDVRRPFLRFFALHEDLSHQGSDSLLPREVAEGVEPLHIVGAVAGG